MRFQLLSISASAFIEKQLSIEATCRADGSRTLREAADHLGVSHASLKSHLHRARYAC
jgi:predicted ArsR family transcriptional regulator